MSQKPNARRMAMVRSRTLAITRSLRETQLCFFRDSPLLPGAGRQLQGGRGGPRAGRTAEGTRNRRAEVRPRLPGGGPGPLRSEPGSGDSFEGLVFAEVRDSHSERVDRDQLVGHL